jgi:hypothetical protein
VGYFKYFIYFLIFLDKHITALNFWSAVTHEDNTLKSVYCARS